MTLTLQEFESDCVICASVIHPGPPDQRAFVELEQALDALRLRIDARTTSYFAIEAHSAGSKPSKVYKDRVARGRADQFVPFARFTTDFWDACFGDSELYRQLEEFLRKLEDLASYATRADGGIWYLCESDEVLFAQPILCYLAMRHLQFVPNYTRMLSYWRIEESSAWCANDVQSLANQHGECAETDALIRAYFQNGGPHLDADDYEHLLENIELS